MITSPGGQELKAYPYDNFQGIDTSRDIASLDTGDKQYMYKIDNGYTTYRGIIMRDRLMRQRSSVPGDRLISHVAFYGIDLLAWAQRDGGGITLCAEPNGISKKEVFPNGSTVSSAIFNNKLVFFSKGYKMQIFDGVKFEESTNENEQPAFGVAIQRRLAIAGGPGRTKIVDISRVDDLSIFTRDEDETTTSATRAADIDVSNVIGTADEITGLGVFENTRLAVFTKDKALVYSITTDYTKWALDDKSSVSVGCISHNSIISVGSDLIFCARNGIYSLRRSEANGVTIYAVPLSANIEELYKDLVASVPKTSDISACYDRDNGQYHVFFPQNDKETTRLTITISPSADSQNKWSTASYLNQRCGTSLGGIIAYGTSGGVFEAKEFNVASKEGDYQPELEIVTPILWHGSLTETKQAREFILQASGKGNLIIEAFNEDGRKIHSMILPLEEGDTKRDYKNLPLSKQYNRPFVFQYKGVRFRMRTEGESGRIKIIGFAVLVEVKKGQ